LRQLREATTGRTRIRDIHQCSITSASFGLRANSPKAPKWRIYEKGPRKYDYWRLYGFIVMVLKYNDMKLRTILFVAPWCRWMFNKKGVPMGFGQI